MEKPNNHIPFVLGEETRPKIESFIANDKYSIDITQSIFYNQYCTALSSVAELISYNKEFNKSDQHKTRNNIIIFTGDRGSGKTSCMMTVKELLCNTYYKNELFNKLHNITDSAKNILINTYFQELETIGPMYFDHNHNILELFIGNLYIKFKEKEYNRQQSYFTSHQDSTHSDRDKLLNKFSEAKRNLSLLYKKDYISEYDNLEELKDLAASMNLRTSLWELVQEYINYMYGEGNQLILDIDDIDLNMTNAYETIEQIRKYLKIPGLIILMSVKFDQLANVIRIKHTKEYESLLKIDPKKYYEVVSKLVEKHLTKTFPLSQRVKLPRIDDLLDKNFKIIHTCTFPDGEKEKYLEPLKKGLLSLIYQKTGLLFFNSPRHPNYIIPSNLRELLNFIHHLYDLKSANNHKEAIPNLFYFRDYFLNTWCTNNLSENDLYLIRKINRIIEPLYLNKLIINILLNRFPILGTIQENKSTKNNLELTFILDNENIAYNISLGDVLACIDWLEKTSVEDKDLMFLFAIKVFYTINLYKSFKYKDEYENYDNENNHILTNNEIEYFDILNGNFFNSEYLNIAPYENGKSSRTRKVINCQSIKLLWEYANNENNIIHNNDIIWDELNYLITENEKETLKKMAEFFMLTTSYVIDSTQNHLLYRKRKNVYYNYSIHSGRKEVCFDILSIFYNILNVSKTYSKFNIKNSYNNNITTTEKDTLKSRLKEFPLYRSIIYQIRETNHNNSLIKAEEFLTYITNIRQIEIIEQISYHLQQNRPKKSNLIDIYKEIFSNLANYSAKSYEGNNIHNYNYSFFNVFKELLIEIKQNPLLEIIFNKIMNNETDIN